MLFQAAKVLGVLVAVASACESCESRQGDVILTRNVRRMQPGALGATSSPRGPLAWGEINFLHTTDTHGWLEGHLKEQNYGADWGDFVSFTKRMKQTAADYGVDLLLVDTGDLHDGNGLSDKTYPDGKISNPIFENIDYDILTIGNHELYLSSVAYETFRQFAKAYGERYLTTNVEILNRHTGKYEYIGHRSREFTTPKGVKILALGILYDFFGNSNASRITVAADLIQETWFNQTILNTDADLIVLLGHNPPRPGAGGTFSTIINAIRAMKPHKPIQVFGGHTHIRDFVVFDHTATGLEAGRYCETLGWLSINGLRDGATKNKIPANVPQATRPAVAVGNGSAANMPVPVSHPRYSRRYIDWNRLSFEYHAKGSQSGAFDTSKGVALTKNITEERTKLNLSKLFGCAPQTWCESCKPFGDPDNIFTVLTKALSKTVINSNRSNTPRFILLNTGSVRFDLIKGPFTLNDRYIVSPFTDTFQYLPNVPYQYAKQVLGFLNNGGASKRFVQYSPFADLTTDLCLDPGMTIAKRGDREMMGSVIRRQNTSTLTPGYTTSDDFGTDGDDTIHSAIPYFSQPEYFQANASFPAGTPGANTAVDLVFLDFIASYVISALKAAGATYNSSQVASYLPSSFTAQDYLPAYAKVAQDWQKNVPNCPVSTD